MNVSRTVVVTVAVVLIGLLGFGAYAFAQSDDGGRPWRNGPAWHDGDRGPRGWRGGAADPESLRDMRADLAADLAAELDTSAEEVEAAFRAVVAQRLEEAAEDGRIDQAEVDEALAAYDEGDVRALFETFKHDRVEATESS